MSFGFINTYTITATTSSTKILSFDGSRKHFSIKNIGENNVYVHFGSEDATVNNSVLVEPNKLFEPFNPGNGEISLIAEANSDCIISTDSNIENIESGFSPLDIDGLHLWLDSNNTGFSYQNNDPVDTWNDLSGNNRHASQIWGNDNRPIFISSSINNNPAISFDDTPERKFLQSSINLTNNVVYVFFVAKRTQFNSFQSIVGLVSSVGNTDDHIGGAALFMNFSSSDRVITFRNGTILADSILHPNDNIPFIGRVSFDGNFNDIYVNGSSDISANSSDNFTSNTFQIGARARGSLQFADVPAFYDVGEILIYDQLLDNLQINQIEDYLSNKWSI